MPRISFPQIFLLDWIVVTVGLLDLSDSWGRKTVPQNFSNQFFSPSSLSISHAFCSKSRPRVSSSCVLPSPAHVLAILYLASSGCLPQYHNSETFQSSYLLFVPYHDLQVLENLPIWTHSSIFPSWEGARTMNNDNENDNDERDIDDDGHNNGSYHVVRAYCCHSWELR